MMMGRRIVGQMMAALWVALPLIQPLDRGGFPVELDAVDVENDLGGIISFHQSLPMGAAAEVADRVHALLELLLANSAIGCRCELLLDGNSDDFINQVGGTGVTAL
jgi:hypothetical protein